MLTHPTAYQHRDSCMAPVRIPPCDGHFGGIEDYREGEDPSLESGPVRLGPVYLRGLGLQNGLR